MAALLKRLEDAYPDGLRVVYRHYPLLSIHDKAMITAEGAEAAGAQGKFWEMHDLIFERQQDWGSRTPEEMVDVLTGYARELGLDDKRFARELQQHTYRDRVQKASDAAQALGLPGTPSIFVNGQYYDGPRSDDVLIGLIKLFNYHGPQYASPPPMAIDPTKPHFANFDTTKGKFCAELFAAQVPKTVNNFVFLAQEGFYNGVLFHRVLPDFVAQTGDPTGGGYGTPGYRFDDEIRADLKHDGPGLLSMANAGTNTNGSQFFITYKALPDLDGKHTIFGRVVQGMDVVEKLTPRDPQSDPYAPADKVNTITISSSCTP
jgi:cyclophilin family peptidyl-prolyl cis-trans isomerase